jgi:hypothetical protein
MSSWFSCLRANARMFPKSHVATICFSCSPLHSGSQKYPFPRRPLNYLSKLRISPSTTITNFRVSSDTTTSYQRNVFTFALQLSLVTCSLLSWRYRRQSVDQDSVVGIATCYELDDPGIESRWEGRHFPHPSRPALRPNQPPIPWVPGLCPAGKAVEAWH